MRFLVDAGEGRSVEQLLARQFEVESVLDLDPHRPDYKILALAHQQEMVIVTMDKDFGELIFNGKYPHHGVLLLRLEEANATERQHVVEQIVKHHLDQIPNNFCVYQNRRLRVKQAEPR